MTNRIANATQTNNTNSNSKLITETVETDITATALAWRLININSHQTHTAHTMLARKQRFTWRFPDLRSRRRRRRSTTNSNCHTLCSNTPANLSFQSCNNNNTNNATLNLLSSLRQSITQSAKAVTCIALLMLSATCSLCNASPCETTSWWDPLKDSCIPCTVCQGELIPLRPCQLHRDTICGSIYDLKIDWVVLAKTEPNWKERRKLDEAPEYLEHHVEHRLTAEQLQQLHSAAAFPMDWQTVALFLAVLACLVFFIVAACILIHHMRQWRRMERRLDQDVEELSTKLMAKLAEVQTLEGGTFFIGNADALRIPATFQPQHVLLPDKPAKHHERRIMKNLQPGNVYIEENSSKG